MTRWVTTRFCARTALLLTVGMALLLLLIRLLPGDQSRFEELRALITPPEGCPMPCWAGIQPDVTPLLDALTLLAAHPWVGRISNQAHPVYLGHGLVVTGTVTWDWNGTQPGILTDTRFNVLSVQSGIVTDIQIDSHALLGDLWLLLGQPDASVISGDAQDPNVRELAVQYPEKGSIFAAVLHCPLDTVSFWQAQLAVEYNVRLRDARWWQPLDGLPRPECW